MADPITAALTAIAASIAEMFVVVNATALEVTGLTATVGTIGTQVADLETRVTTIQTGQESLTSKVEAIENEQWNLSVVGAKEKMISLWAILQAIVSRSEEKIQKGLVYKYKSDTENVGDAAMPEGYLIHITGSWHKGVIYPLQWETNAGGYNGKSSVSLWESENFSVAPYHYDADIAVCIKFTDALIWLAEMINECEEKNCDTYESGGDGVLKNGADLRRVFGFKSIVGGHKVEVNDEWLTERMKILLPLWFSNMGSDT